MGPFSDLIWGMAQEYCRNDFPNINEYNVDYLASDRAWDGFSDEDWRKYVEIEFNIFKAEKDYGADTRFYLDLANYVYEKQDEFINEAKNIFAKGEQFEALAFLVSIGFNITKARDILNYPNELDKI